MNISFKSFHKSQEFSFQAYELYKFANFIISVHYLLKNHALYITLSMKGHIYTPSLIQGPLLWNSCDIWLVHGITILPHNLSFWKINICAANLTEIISSIEYVYDQTFIQTHLAKFGHDWHYVWIHCAHVWLWLSLWWNTLSLCLVMNAIMLK